MTVRYHHVEYDPFPNVLEMLGSLKNAHGKHSFWHIAEIVTREKECIPLYSILNEIEELVVRRRWAFDEATLNVSIQVIDKLRFCFQEAQNSKSRCTRIFERLFCCFCPTSQESEELDDTKNKLSKTLDLSRKANEERKKFLQLPVTERRETLFPAALTGLDRDFTIHVGGRVTVIADPIPQYYVPDDKEWWW